MTQQSEFSLWRMLLLASFAVFLMAHIANADLSCTGSCGVDLDCGTGGCICSGGLCKNPGGMLCMYATATSPNGLGNCVGPAGSPIANSVQVGLGGVPSVVREGNLKYLDYPGRWCNASNAVEACRNLKYVSYGGVITQATPICGEWDDTLPGLISQCSCSDVGTALCDYVGCVGDDPSWWARALYLNCGTFKDHYNECLAAGCAWQGSPPPPTCSLNANDQCSPSGLPPNCCSGSLQCIEVGGGSFECRSCIPYGSTTTCTGSGQGNCCTAVPPIICKVSSMASPGNRRCETCSNSAQHCGADSDCCFGLTCNGGTCSAPPPPCSATRDTPCPVGNECCNALYPKCVEPAGGGARTCQSCISLNSPSTCTSPSDCCTGTCSGWLCVAPPMPATFCRADQFNDVLFLSGLASLAMAALIALAYMFGEFFGNARFVLWGKAEALQIFVSLAAVVVILWFLSIFCQIQIGELNSMLGVALPVIYQAPHNAENLYSGALLYLENLAALGLEEISSLRYNLGAYEIRTSFNEYMCDSFCLFSLSSVNVAVFGGETMHLAITNNLMGTATIAYLSAIFQYFTLLFIIKGLFIEFLPLAIIMRSVPFMRQFGGALIAIFVSLYLLYPAMLVADAFILPGFTAYAGGMAIYDRDGGGCSGAKLFGSSVSCLTGPLLSLREDQLQEAAGTSRGSMDSIAPQPLAQSIKINVLIFLASVFLPAMNFIVVAALARDLSRFLGEEADISRLGQMV